MKPRLALITAVAAVALTASACGSSDTATPAASSTSSSTTAETPMETPMETPSETPSETMAADPAGLVGPGCADYAKAVPSGAGSVEGMSKDPVATAAANNPLLKTLVAAVSGKLNPKVKLVDTLNKGEFTVFAPVDTAFAKLPAATVKTLGTNSDLLSKILTYHVVPGQLDATQVVGTHKTVEGGELTVSGSGNDLKVDGKTAVICGNVKTANATVYLIDTVLTPPAS